VRFEVQSWSSLALVYGGRIERFQGIAVVLLDCFEPRSDA
jgi:hypothetical protein